MPNEILFRGQRKDNKEWIEGYYTNIGKEWHYILTGKLIIGLTGMGFERSEVDPETVGQFTGLYDKNGKKIFEGDIVKTIAHSCEFTGSIEYSIKHIRFVCITKSKITYPMDSSFEYEVIGNIHDNPELLGTGGTNNG